MKKMLRQFINDLTDPDWFGRHPTVLAAVFLTTVSMIFICTCLVLWLMYSGIGMALSDTFNLPESSPAALPAMAVVLFLFWLFYLTVSGILSRVVRSKQSFFRRR